MKFLDVKHTGPSSDGFRNEKGQRNLHGTNAQK